MDKRQLRQSAIADFMQSLEHLDELLGDTAEAADLGDETQASEASKPQPSSHQKIQHAAANSEKPGSR
ncbi:MAG: hypothetical protein AAGI69_10925 [Cyanobacteria bacterium P01_H01_bin.21]